MFCDRMITSCYFPKRGFLNDHSEPIFSSVSWLLKELRHCLIIIYIIFLAGLYAEVVHSALNQMACMFFFFFCACHLRKSSHCSCIQIPVWVCIYLKYLGEKMNFKLENMAAPTHAYVCACTFRCPCECARFSLSFCTWRDTDTQGRACRHAVKPTDLRGAGTKC